MRALKQECAKVKIAISVVAPGITVTNILSNNNPNNDKDPEAVAKELAKNGVAINQVESVALAVCWLFNEGIAANGAGIFVQADKFSDLERGLAKSREHWMGYDMLALFKGGRNAAVFKRLDSEASLKSHI